jgi:hypothetical protein
MCTALQLDGFGSVNSGDFAGSEHKPVQHSGFLVIKTFDAPFALVSGRHFR